MFGLMRVPGSPQLWHTWAQHSSSDTIAPAQWKPLAGVLPAMGGGDCCPPSLTSFPSSLTMRPRGARGLLPLVTPCCSSPQGLPAPPASPPLLPHSRTLVRGDLCLPSLPTSFSSSLNCSPWPPGCLFTALIWPRI